MSGMMRSEKLLRVQLLRGIAAIVVTFGHAQGWGVKIDSEFSRLNFEFGIGVDIFFLISGFIMIFTSQHLFGSAGSCVQFLKRRIVRIAPLYWIFTLLMITALFFTPSQVSASGVTIWEAIRSFLFIPYQAADNDIQPIFQLGWTLNYEFFFYVVFACFLFLPQNLAVVSLSATMVFFVLIGMSLDLSFSAPLTFWTNPIILEFVAGVWVGLLFLKTGRKDSRILCAFLIIMSGLSYALLQSEEYFRIIKLGIPAFFVFIGLVFYLPASIERKISGFSSLSGDTSYSLYLSHPFTLSIVQILWDRFGPDTGYTWAYVVLATAISFLVGVAVYFVIEKPVLRVIRNLNFAGKITSHAS
ncbi:acyltransferase [Paracoccus sp. IB05]|uniref:acyltransferase family protein n=1 Tax=Paracoccus sp. IB05 TaxID=2779367 RepID=UPI0018E81D84|nr:acyltransferase [Paracoccus sp. IB05]MBJ2152695.1 acyltransferase [Paracoccus sp. IB05]